MFTNYEIKRVKNPDDPNRCQFMIGSAGQCLNQAVPGGKYCPIHGGGMVEKSRQKKEIKNYYLAKDKYRQIVEAKADSPKLKSLREEIGILRMILETLLNKIEDDVDLIINAPKISDLVMKVEKVVLSANKLEASLGNLLDKQFVINFSNRLIQLINNIFKNLVQAGELKEEIAKKAIDEIAEELISEIGE